MSNNHHFYNHFRGNHHTFQNIMPPFSVPPPPPPPKLVIVPPPSRAPTIDVLDKECVRDIEQRIPNVLLKKPKTVSISVVRDKLRCLLLDLNNLMLEEKALEAKVDILSDEKWRSALEEIKQQKSLLKKSLSELNSSHLDIVKKALAKRTAKRLRLKRRNIEIKHAKEEIIKELEEKSRKIDENLQKIKDSVIKAKEEEEAKLQADIILKEVSRKKHNAKKCINKLDALKKLRKARVNTAKGRGDNVSEMDAEEFDGKIDKLKLLWAQKLISYEKEEEDLRAQLKQDGESQAPKESDVEKKMASNLRKWRKALFGEGSAGPQVDFNGDVGRFVAVRCQWDQYVNDSGSPLPIGWVAPTRTYLDSS